MKRDADLASELEELRALTDDEWRDLRGPECGTRLRQQVLEAVRRHFAEGGPPDALSNAALAAQVSPRVSDEQIGKVFELLKKALDARGTGLRIVRTKGNVRVERDLAPPLARTAERVRARLVPETLSPLHRAAMERRIIPKLRAALAGTPKVFAIVAPAGYGKTTLLGQLVVAIEDALPDLAPMVCRADDLRRDLGMRDALASLATGRPMAWDDLASALPARGALFLDTLDIALRPESTTELASMLTDLADRGWSSVLTCRDWEFREYFPSGLDAEEHQLGLFDQEEALRAAEEYMERMQPDAHARGRFMARLGDLMRDSRRRDRIVRNPLLLSIICRLYGDECDIPKDLTVLRLYDDLVRLRITGARNEEARHPSRVNARHALVHALVDHCAAESAERLVEFAPRSRVVVPDLQGAFDELRSASILEETSGGLYIGFFHQTFLEYLLGHRLAADGDAAARFMGAVTSAKGPAPFMEPILRVYLSVSAPDELLRFLEQGPLSSIVAFRAAAFAAAAHRVDLPAWEKLVTATGARPEALGDVLVDAVEARADLRADSGRGALLAMARGLLDRQVRNLVPTLVDASADAPDGWIRDLADALGAKSQNKSQDVLSAFVAEAGRRESGARVLVALRDHLGELGDKARAALVLAFAVTDDSAARAAFMETLLQAAPDSAAADANAELVLAAIRDVQRDSGVEAATGHALAALRTGASAPWRLPAAVAAGRWIAADGGEHPAVALVECFSSVADADIEGPLIALRELVRVGRRGATLRSAFAARTDAYDERRFKTFWSFAHELYEKDATLVPEVIAQRARQLGLGVAWLNEPRRSSVSELQELALGNSREEALDAAANLERRADECNLGIVTALLASQYDGVRQGAYRLARALVRNDAEVDPDAFLLLLERALLAETKANVFSDGCGAIAACLSRSAPPSDVLGPRLALLQDRSREDWADGGCVNSILHVWKSFVPRLPADERLRLWPAFDGFVAPFDVRRIRGSDKVAIMLFREFSFGALAAMRESIGLAEGLKDGTRVALVKGIRGNGAASEWLGALRRAWPELEVVLLRER